MLRRNQQQNASNAHATAAYAPGHVPAPPASRRSHASGEPAARMAGPRTHAMTLRSRSRRPPAGADPDEEAADGIAFFDVASAMP